MSRNILKNIRILDFSWVLAGPYATRLLADFGAEVIKVQPLLPEAEDKFSKSYYNAWNRNKLGITLNLAKPEGVEIARKLVGISHAVVENFSSRVMANFGLDYPELIKIKPDIIMLSLSVMGHTGPQQDYCGFGPTVQAFSGMTGLTAYPAGPPLGIGFSYSDHIAALYGSMALLGALEHHRNTGEGQYIDLSQTETAASMMADAILNFTMNGKDPRPVGNSSETAAPHGVYPCKGKDRWCAISVSTEEQWARFKRVMPDQHWVEDPKFKTLNDRLANIEALDNLIKGWTKQHTAEEVMSLLQNENVPAGVVQNAADLARDPQLISRGFFLNTQKPGEGVDFLDASPIKLSGAKAEHRREAPDKGRDNDYVYSELLGISEHELIRLRESNVI